ncbi:hypothetical protein PF006_g21009 [Phytophthora fragariae]|uniref:Probable pectate lyase F n=2 Tax=Phytophthora fragariae TaxID=53985 RepID=A0A6A3S101_9STRA|nr:hypothetical protein PF006_g21009 [Phytophthora fragariae]
MDKLVQLQAVLRAIETGRRLESVDGVLVRQVLLQPRVQPQQAAPEPDAKDLYRELLVLRRAKAKANARPPADPTVADTRSDDEGATTSPSPKKATSTNRTVSVVDARLESAAPSSPERSSVVLINNNDKNMAEELAAGIAETNVLMQTALVAREKELRRSERAVARADAELREEINRAEKLLPSKFLFERNLASDRALEAARTVLVRFQHRFYKLYFRHWWVATLELRLQAQRRAVAQIVRVYRGHRGRLEARRLRRELNAMQAQKRQLLAFRIKYRSSQAVKLQMAWRRFLRHRAVKHCEARQAAARLLQQAFRTRQWRSQSLVTALANARRLFAAVSMQKLYRGHRTRRKLLENQRRQRQDERVQLALLRGMSKRARAVWMIERRGAGYLIAHQAIFPYAMRRRWHRLHDQLRRQRAAKRIARVVCNWFGVEGRREVARAEHIRQWLALVQREHKRSQPAALLIQKHLRRWVQQRKFLMARARRKKLARRTRLAEKTRRLNSAQPFKGTDGSAADRKSPTAALSPARRSGKMPRFPPNLGLNPQPARLMALLKPMQLKNAKSQPSQVESAKLLQRSYRRYRVRKRAQIRAWKTEAQKVEMRVLRRRKAATEIQRRVRGIQGRQLARVRRAERLLLRFILRWKWRRIQKRQHAARKIARWFKHKRTQALAKLWCVEMQKRRAACTRILRWYRLCCLLPSRMAKVLRAVRKCEETFAFCDQSLLLCRQHVTDGFVVQSFGASLEDALRPLLSDPTPASRSPSKTRPSPTKQKAGAATSGKHQATVVSFPILQMAFLIVSGWKMPFVWRELDGKTLFQTKLERAKAVAFFRSLAKRGKPVAHQIQHTPTAQTEPTSSSPTRRNQKPVPKGAKGVAAVETFSSVDVDVAVARATGGAKGALDLAAFIRVVGFLGEISLTQNSQSTSPYWGRYDGTEARVLALLWFSLLSHPAMQSLSSQFQAYVSDELSRHASRLQRLFTRQLNKSQGAAVLVEIRLSLRTQELSRAAVVLQTQARRFLARRELRRRMQATYEKFLDPTWGLPYWMNPRSGYSTWHKPRMLGAEDVQCEPVPFPPPERTLKAPCNGRKDCDRCAEWVCYDCDEFFCVECFGEFHKSKAILENSANDKEEPLDASQESEKDDEDTQPPVNREHELERLLICGLCKFQLASRRCLDCIPKPGTKSTPKLPPKPNQSPGKQQEKKPDNSEDERSNSEALFCDVCFGFLHRRGGLKTHRTEPLLELCTSCSPDDNDDTNAISHQQQSTNFGIAGAADAVQWECEACGDPPRRVCGRCALKSHPKESCGELRPVPLQTLGRRERTKRLQEEQEARDRRDLDKMRARALRARQERCARKLQTFWRSRAPILRAKRIADARRKVKSDLWLRRQEDARLAKRMAYRAKNALGMAPPLSTDTPVQRRLRTLHALARRQLSIRARFFGLLIDEYVRVGIPLPGLGLLHPGSNEIWTSEDLRGWIRNRQTIRLKLLTPQEAQPAERALCAWRQLEHWSKNEDETDNEAQDSGTEPKVSDTTWLADVHPKQLVTENTIPLAQAYDPPLPKKRSRKAADEEEDAVEDVPVAMFLVEFSLDPKRTMWINHSLAERFWEWKRLKMSARSERAAQRQRAKEYVKQRKELEEKQKQEEELNRQGENAATAVDTQDPPLDGAEMPATTDPTPNTATEQAWPSAWPTVDPYYNYNYYPSDQANAAETWTGYEGYSASYPAGYDYGYSPPVLETCPMMAGGTAGLVDSSSYYGSGGYAGADINGSNPSNWYGTEYSAYDMSGYGSAATDYGSNAEATSGWGYDGAVNYAESQPSIDPNAAWYANGGDYNATEQWQQGQPASSYQSSATDGYYNYDPTEAFTAQQPTAAAQWEEVFDPATQQTYYVNRVTNETAWQIPS